MTTSFTLGTLAQSLVSEQMVSPIVVVRDTDRLGRAEQEMTKLGLSALPVVDQAGGLVGLISRTDLLRAGRVRVMNGHRRKVLTLPDAGVREFMTATVEIVPPTATMAQAAHHMARQHIHRVFISEDRRPQGVVSTNEMMHAVVAARTSTSVGELMHHSVVSVHAGDPLSLAIDRMAASHHRSIVVLDQGWPVGVFTQANALEARDAPPDAPVDAWMDARVICAPVEMPLFRAADQLLATRALGLLAVDGQGTRGILTGMDFVRLVGHAPRAPTEVKK